jgi:hypothetical protein
LSPLETLFVLVDRVGALRRPIWRIRPACRRASGSSPYSASRCRPSPSRRAAAVLDRFGNFLGHAGNAVLQRLLGVLLAAMGGAIRHRRGAGGVGGVTPGDWRMDGNG